MLSLQLNVMKWDQLRIMSNYLQSIYEKLKQKSFIKK